MSKNDNIERTFQDKFEPKNVSDMGWNSPSDRVWEKVESRLNKNEKKPFGFLSYILASGLLISLIGLGYIANENSNLSTELNALQIELNDCADHSNNAIINDYDNMKSPLESGLNVLPLSNTSQDLDLSSGGLSSGKIKPQSGVSPTSTSKTISNIIHPEDKSITEVKSKLIEGLPEGFLSVELVEKSRDQIWIQALASVATKNEISYQNTSIINVGNMDIIQPISKLQPNSFISLSGGAIANSLISNGSQMSALTELIDREYAKLGSVFEIKYVTGISDQWSLSSGIGILNQSFITEYDITLPYDVSAEKLHNGQGYIDFEHSLPTSFGNTDTELRLRRSDADQVLEEENVNIDFDTKHRFISLSAPLSLDYLTGTLESGFYLGLDVIPSYIVSARSGISSVISRHSEVESINNTSFSTYENLQKWNLQVGGHLGYRYSLTEGSGIDLSAKYVQNLNSYFSTDSFSSRSQGVQLSAGYFFRF